MLKNTDKIKKILILITLLVIVVKPSYTIEISEIQAGIKGLNSNFSANFSYSSSSGEMFNGKIYYEYPNKLNVQLNDGRVIATNGKFLWVYDPQTKICARQAVKEETIGGIFYFLNGGYSVQENNGRYTFTRPDAVINEVNLIVEDSILKSVQFIIKEEVINMSFSNVVPDTGIKASLFNYKPNPEAQIVENPLNRVANIMIQNQSSQSKE